MEGIRQSIFYKKETVISVTESLQQKIGAQNVFARAEEFTPSIEVNPQRIVDAMRVLHDLGYTFLDSISGVDLSQFEGPELDRSVVGWSAAYPAPKTITNEDNSSVTVNAPLFLLVYHLFNLEKKAGLIIKAIVAGTDQTCPQIPSIDNVYGNANWLEREVFDLVGIQFSGSVDLRRLMLPEDWEGHPLRKDYVQGATYAGMSTSRPDPLDVLRRYQAEQKAKLDAGNA